MIVVTGKGKICSRSIEQKEIGDNLLVEYSISSFQGKDKKTGEFKKPVFITLQVWNPCQYDAPIEGAHVDFIGELIEEHWINKAGENRSRQKIRCLKTKIWVQKDVS